MTCQYLRLLATLGLMLLCCPANGQWVSANGPATPYFQLFLTRGDSVYANGAFGGIVISTDQGLTWTEIKGGLPPNRTVIGMSAVGSDLLAITSESVFRSTDNGKVWFPAMSGLPEWFGASAIVSMDDNVFVGGSKGVYVTSNRGIQWTKTGSGNLASPINVNSLSVIGHVLFATTQGSAFLSSDNGATWNQAGSGLPLNIRVVHVIGSRLFAGSYSNVVFASTDSGKTWSPSNNALAGNRVTTFAANETTLFAGTFDGGVFRSTDFGSNWVEVNVGISVRRIQSLLMAGRTLLAGAWGGTLYRSTTMGQDWGSVEGGIPPFSVSALAVKGHDLFATVYQGGRAFYAALYHSTNAGETWSAEFAALEIISICIKDAQVFCGTSSGVYRSPVHGSHWTQASFGLPNISYINSIGCTDSLLFLGTDRYGVYSSSDDGEHWMAVNDGFSISTPGSFPSVRALACSGDLLFAGTGQGVYRRALQGGTWSQANTGLQDLDVYGIIVADGILIVRTISGAVFRSADNGDHWKRVFFNSADSIAVSIAPGPMGSHGTELFAGSGDGEIFHSNDRGTTWTKDSLVAPDPPDFIYVGAIAADDKYVYAGTGLSDMDGIYGEIGIWKRKLSDFTTPVKATVLPVPASCSLLQNYPNPFNPSTTIRYGLPARSHVSLTVFNTLGQQVAVLQNGEQEAGYHEVRFDGANLPCGVYFYRLQARSFTETKKLLQVR